MRILFVVDAKIDLKVPLLFSAMQAEVVVAQPIGPVVFTPVEPLVFVDEWRPEVTKVHLIVVNNPELLFQVRTAAPDAIVLYWDNSTHRRLERASRSLTPSAADALLTALSGEPPSGGKKRRWWRR